jgi:O-antigen/teichoic acid export membrane protein
MAENEQPRSLTFSSSLIMLARASGYICSMALPLVLARIFPLYDLGVYKQIFVAINTLMGILPLGFFMSVYYYLPRDPARREATVNHVFFFNLTLGGIGCLTLVLFPQLLGHLFGDPLLTRYAPVIGLTTLLWMAGGLLEAVTLANSEIWLSSLVILGTQLFRTLFLLLTAFWFRSVDAMLVVAVAQGVLQMGVLAWYLGSRFPGFWKAGDRSFFWEQLHYSLPLGLSGMIYLLTADLHNYFVSNAYGAAMFAIYSTGCFQLPLVGVLGDSVNAVLLPRISQLQAEGRTEEIVSILVRAVRKLALVYMPFCMGLALVTADFITILFTDKFAGSIPIFRINLGLLLVNLIVVDPVARAYKQFRFALLRMQLVTLSILVVCLWLGTKPLGLEGTIAIVVANSLLMRLGILWVLSSGMGLNGSHLKQLKEVARVGAATLVAGLVGWLTLILSSGSGHWQRLIVVGAVFGISYLALLFLMRVLLPEERDLIRVWLGRIRRLEFRGA